MKYSSLNMIGLTFLILSCNQASPLHSFESTQREVPEQEETEEIRATVTLSDTFNIGSYTIVINEIGSDYKPINYPPQQNSYEREDSVIQKSKRVVRVGDTLRFFSTKMNKLDLVTISYDNADDPIGDPAYYYLDKIHPKNNFSEVFVLAYEYHWTMLVNQRNLDTININGTGTFSPEGDLLFYSNIDMESGFTPHGFGLVELEDNTHRHIGFQWLGDYGIQEFSWTPEGILYAKKYKISDEYKYEVTDVYIEILK